MLTSDESMAPYLAEEPDELPTRGGTSASSNMIARSEILASCCDSMFSLLVTLVVPLLPSLFSCNGFSCSRALAPFANPAATVCNILLWSLLTF